MAKRFDIHEWQAKQRLVEKIDPSKVPGTAAWDKRAGLTVGGSDVNPKLEECKEINDMFEEVNRAAQGWLKKWINEDHIAKALEDYNQGWDDFEEKTLWALNFISTASPAEDMIGSGGTTKEYKK